MKKSLKAQKDAIHTIEPSRVIFELSSHTRRTFLLWTFKRGIMVEVAFGDKAEQEGLEAIKALSKHSKRIQFDDRDQAKGFVEELKILSEGQDFTYCYKPLDDTQAAPQIQVMSTE